MQLTVREAAQLLEVPEEVVHKWIRDRGLPAVRFNEQYRLNRVELVEWAQRNRIPVLPAPSAKHRQPLPRISAALESGGLQRDVPGRSKVEVIRAVVARLPLPPGLDRGFLTQMLLAREDQGSTGFGDGIAIPHVRNPIVLQIEKPIVTLSYLATPVDFGAMDGQPVFALFTIVNPTIRVHLHLLSRLALLLKSPGFARRVQDRAGLEEIVAEARAVEAGLEAPATP